MANLLHLFLLAVPLIAAVSVSAVFINIDCGSADSFTSTNFMVWQSDDSPVGKSQVVQNAASIPRELTTLRVFPTRKKNCYSFEVDKGGQILVRATFYYGNYDRKSSPPSFDLQFDGNNWTTVTTSLDEIVSHEAIYVAKGETTSVCVAQTQPNQLPFISSLEVSSLDAGMYNLVDSNRALFLLGRFAYGAKDIVRYSDDAYDRIWTPVAAPNGLTAVTSEAILITTNIDDNPPATVLETALTPTLTSDSISLTPDNLLTGSVPVYINAYFSEVTQLDSSVDKRLIDILINNVTVEESIEPPFENVVEFRIANITADAGMKMTLVAATGSTLPPIINALEFFRISDVLTVGTDNSDVQALILLQEQFVKLQEWNGDPCLPATFNWEWVSCSSDPTPRITALNLSGLQLDGPLPDFSALDALQTIDMRNNSINGEIPAFLGTLPNLKQLNLAGNDFSGPIPLSVSRNNKIKLDLSGNPNLCASGKNCKTSSTGTSPSDGTGTTTSPDSGTSMELPSGKTKKKKSKLPVILGSTIPSILVFWAVVGFLAVTRQRRKTTAAAAAAQMGGPGKHGGPAAMGTGSSTAQVHDVNGQDTANDIRVEIGQQMGSEINDLFQQQAQENENGHHQ